MKEKSKRKAGVQPVRRPARGFNSMGGGLRLRLTTPRRSRKRRKGKR